MNEKTCFHVEMSLCSELVKLLFVLLDRRQRMPLGNRTSWRGEHVGPVSQLGPTCPAADNDAADWVVVADLDNRFF